MISPLSPRERTQLHDRIHGGLGCQACPVYELIDAAAIAGHRAAAESLSDRIDGVFEDYDREIRIVEDLGKGRT